ncbi:acyl carrier protein phosphodiesterase [Halobacteroides halobius DSM 5150]|uniref:FMN dependent NADH:quinone oxidoreductase n=1 Tax=Halobacteroides halobius (strain ATCC 35273 / DSM 5150 / MD-1) TaxID=748449 RepID=L0KDK6_HALHC|nr:FMN-dependent NADH-azoreductase [Halobacteroides halobius]AGB42454.1 acyl carrier protein phosphodiesterase [Halobacteroides halobius DSM 5150]
MSKVLYIKANPKSDENSYTFQMSENFVEKYKEENPNDKVITLDLYEEEIEFLDGQKIADMFGGNDNVMKGYAESFAEVDKYIIAAPMWNLSIPAILKAYIDYVAYVGVTFKYTEEGPVGLLSDKKAVHITARGGSYSEGPAVDFEMGDRYLRTILGFMGITDVATVTVENTNVLEGEELEHAVNSSVAEAKELAKEF